jgi:hypothetical protein
VLEFPNIRERNTAIKRYGYFKISGSPLFPKKGGGLWPPFVHFALLLRGKMEFRQIFKKRVPAKSSKGVPAKSYSKKYPQ